MTPETIAKRAAAIRYPRKTLAAVAGLHEDTVERVLNDKCEGRRATLDKLAIALRREELRLARYLARVLGGAAF